MSKKYSEKEQKLAEKIKPYARLVVSVFWFLVAGVIAFVLNLLYNHTPIWIFVTALIPLGGAWLVAVAVGIAAWFVDR